MQGPCSILVVGFRVSAQAGTLENPGASFMFRLEVVIVSLKHHKPEPSQPVSYLVLVYLLPLISFNAGLSKHGR